MENSTKQALENDQQMKEKSTRLQIHYIRGKPRTVDPFRVKENLNFLLLRLKKNLIRKIVQQNLQ